jgi:hypothetical protein
MLSAMRVLECEQYHDDNGTTGLEFNLNGGSAEAWDLLFGLAVQCSFSWNGRISPSTLDHLAGQTLPQIPHVPMTKFIIDRLLDGLYHYGAPSVFVFEDTPGVFRFDLMAFGGDKRVRSLCDIIPKNDDFRARLASLPFSKSINYDHVLGVKFDKTNKLILGDE